MNRILAILEVISVTALTWIAYKAMKLVEPLGFDCSPGFAMLLAAIGMMVLHRRDFASYGVLLDRWRYALTLGVAVNLLFVLAGIIVVTLFPIGATTPASRPFLMTLSVCAVFALLSLAFFYSLVRLNWLGLGERIPLVCILALTAVLLLAAPAFALQRGAPPWEVTGVTVVLVLFTAFGEELFFRGCVQSRLNRAFGRPWRFLGASLGPGLFVSALLFGVIHIFNPTKPFEAHWEFSWPWGVQACLAGLLNGYLRELTGSIWATTVAHGLSGVQLGMWQVFLSKL